MVTNPGDMGHVSTQIEQGLAEAAVDHPWLMAAMDGRDIGRVDGTEILAGLVAMIAALTDSMKLIAAELDRQNASR